VDEVRVGIIGSGNMGATHAASYSRDGRARVTATTDVNGASAQALAESCGAQAYADVETMLAESKLDAISICTPPAFHCQQAVAALKAGVHVLCEKPFAPTVGEAQRMVDASRSSGALLMPAFCHRFHPPVVALKRLVTSGRLGRVTMFRNRFSGEFRGVEKTWFVRRELSGGGVLVDTCSHSVDLFRFLVGEVASAAALTSRHLEGIDTEDTGAILLKSEDGAIGTLEASWLTPVGTAIIEIYGTEGKAVLDYSTGTLSWRVRADADWTTETPESDTDRFTAEVQHFLDAVLGKSKLALTCEDGLRSVEILTRAYAVEKTL
jgi:predicted dehydrogenase